MGFVFLYHLVDEMNHFLGDGAVSAFSAGAKFVIKRIWEFLDVERSHRNPPIFHRNSFHRELLQVVYQAAII
jgi:hypothetical protein